MIVWLKDLKSNWLSWLAISITMLVSSASCSLAISMISADGKDAIPPWRNDPWNVNLCHRSSHV